jgi:Transcriptional regulators
MATEISTVKPKNELALDQALLESLVGTLRRLMWFERNWLRQILAEYDLDIAPFMLLLHLLRHQGMCPIGELSQAMDLPNATTTGHVDRLEQKQLARREYGNAQDRRQVRVHITAQGKALTRRVKEQRLQTVARALRRLPARDRARFVHLLVKFMDELELTQ